MTTYYIFVFILSLILSGVYFYKWQKRYDVYSVAFFTLIPVAQLGYCLLSSAKNVDEAVAVNKFIYIGGCYLSLFIMLCIFNACRINLPKLLKIGMFSVTSLIYGMVLTIGRNDLFYRNISLGYINGSAVLKKEYGPLHIIFYIYIAVTVAAALAVIIYSLLKKRNVSLYVVTFLIVIELAAMAGFFLGRLFGVDIELICVAYIVMQIVYLLMINRICLYDISDNVISGLINDEKYAYISVDLDGRYLGCNKTAAKIFPDLEKLRLDTKIKDGRLGENVCEWVKHFTDKNKDEVQYSHGANIYTVDVDYLFNNEHRVGYQITLKDVTRERRFISLLNHYNTNLKAEVDAKTAHIEEMHDKLILGMAVMVESRDNSTGGHIRRTSDCIKIMVDKIRRNGAYELDEDFCRCLIKAAPMHDLGKIAVDDRILRKPGRFEPEEFEQMKTHAAKGAEIIETILEGTDDPLFRRIAVNVAHYHHERMDGTGYPEGLKGDEIPLEARIMAIVDVYDALVSKRCYKDSMPFDKAFAIIDEGMGTQFDPELRESFHCARAELEAYYG